ncbi:hypothetical protein J6590_068863 [Homalodisca vitripennis]|nr:hypothetical protein J6590_068863 [Homalodisca vitripennis]
MMDGDIGREVRVGSADMRIGPGWAVRFPHSGEQRRDIFHRPCQAFISRDPPQCDPCLLIHSEDRSLGIADIVQGRHSVPVVFHLIPPIFLVIVPTYSRSLPTSSLTDSSVTRTASSITLFNS